MAYHVFVDGLADENLGVLRGLPHADEYAFHQLLTIEELQHRATHLRPDPRGRHGTSRLI